MLDFLLLPLQCAKRPRTTAKLEPKSCNISGIICLCNHIRLQCFPDICLDYDPMWGDFLVGFKGRGNIVGVFLVFGFGFVSLQSWGFP